MKAKLLLGTTLVLIIAAMLLALRSCSNNKRLLNHSEIKDTL